MNSCIGCLLKHIFDANIPISFRCSHQEEVTCVIAVKKNILSLYHLLILGVLAMLIGYAYLLPTNYCAVYTLKCVLLLSDFIYSLTGLTVLFFKLMRVKTNVLSLNGWVKLYEHRDIFGVQYTSLDKEIKILKYRRLFFTTSLYALIVGDVIFTLKFPYVRETTMKLVLEILCAYFQMEQYFEGLQHIAVIRVIYTFFSNSIQNHLLLMLSHDDRFYYYKSSDPKSEKTSTLDNLRSINRFCLAFTKNVKSINAIFRPLAIYWFLEVTFHLIVNFYIIVNAEFEKYKLKIILMGCFLFISVALTTYVTIVSERVNRMVSKIFSLF